MIWEDKFHLRKVNKEIALTETFPHGKPPGQPPWHRVPLRGQTLRQSEWVGTRRPDPLTAHCTLLTICDKMIWCMFTVAEKSSQGSVHSTTSFLKNFPGICLWADSQCVPDHDHHCWDYYQVQYYYVYLAIWAQGRPSTATAAFEKCPRTLGPYASVLWEKK